jgi:membrane-bound lytic murein transglycosylase D
MNIQPIEAPVTETVTVSTAVDLRRVAEWAGTPVETIQELNPELRRWTTPLRAVEYELKVPQGTAATVTERLAAMPSDDIAPLNHYTVRKGETLLAVARKLGVTRSDLAEANYLSTKAALKAGQRLIVPRAPSLVLDARNDTSAPAARERDADVVNASNNASSRASRIDRTGAVRYTHRVKRGETLFSIARRYDTSVESLKEWNRLRGNTIHAGQRLTIYRQTGLAAD